MVAFSRPFQYQELKQGLPLSQQGPFLTDLLPSYRGLSLLEAYFFHVRSLLSLFALEL